MLIRHRDHIKGPFVNDGRSRNILHGIDSTSQQFTSWNANDGELYNIERPDLAKENHELLHFDKNRDELEEDEKSIMRSKEDEDEKSIVDGDFVD